MFYIGDILWMRDEESFKDRSDFENFSGYIRFSNGDQCYFDKALLKSFQNPETGEWLPAIIYADGTKTWYDGGNYIDDPENYSWETGED